jgi:hypothetical protein
MEKKNQHQEFFEKVNNFVTSPIDDLIQNKNKQQQGILIFNELKNGFEEFQNILSYVKEDTILALPEFKINELKRRLEPLFAHVEDIQNLQKKPNQADDQQKQKIVHNLTKAYNPMNPEDSGFFAKEKDPIWEIIVQSIALSNNNNKKDQEAKAILKRLEEIENNAKASSENLQNVLNSAKSELSKSGVEVHSEIFKEQANKHKTNSNKWRKYSLILLIITVTVALGFFAIIAFVLNESDTKKIIETSILAGLIISISTYSLTLTIKNYFAEKHNESINQHKANCLSTFDTFVDSADDERKAAVLLQATQTIFSHQNSGYLSKENEIQNPNPIVEIVRNASNKNIPK